jgi:hypothetical protein
MSPGSALGRPPGPGASCGRAASGGDHLPGTAVPAGPGRDLVGLAFNAPGSLHRGLCSPSHHRRGRAACRCVSRPTAPSAGAWRWRGARTPLRRA